jgi:hypothetical protein
MIFVKQQYDYCHADAVLMITYTLKGSEECFLNKNAVIINSPGKSGAVYQVE